MNVINVAIRGHSAIAMIDKIIRIQDAHPPVAPEIHKLPKYGDDKKAYRKEYNDLPYSCLIKRRNLGLSCKAFKINAEYVQAAKEKVISLENKELAEFIEDQVNGGFAFDNENVFI